MLDKLRYCNNFKYAKFFAEHFHNYGILLNFASVKSKASFFGG